MVDAFMSRSSTRLSRCASRWLAIHELTLAVKENRSKYKDLDFKEQQKELGKDVRIEIHVAYVRVNHMPCIHNVLAIMILTTSTVESFIREPKEQRLSVAQLAFGHRGFL
jgi:hypothetical protein